MSMTRPGLDPAAIQEVERKQGRPRFRLPAIGLLEAMKVTLRAMLTRAVTVHYPEERMELPPRSRGVIALLEENCTVCMLCSKDCPCWCIYIEGHKEPKPGKRKPVNALDRFAIDFGLCMYCGICVEVCPFDALHWSPAFEYTGYTYESLVHEMPVLTQWQHHVLPPPPLVDDADEAARKAADVANAKRTEGIWAVIREQDKKDAYLRAQAASTQAPAPVAPVAPAQAAAAGAAAPVVPPSQRESSDTLPEEAPASAAAQAAGSPVPAPSDVASPQAPAPSPTATDAVAVGAADLGGVPRIDPTNLPPGIGPVERGRLKKLAELQKRGTAPPQDLLDNLKPLLDQMGSA
ncbi:MAG TPA: NADH-quinone oxidoreductase subunit I [Actinomycetota bacterium]|nr:NADH-quinone oxidoreductase subunit I [Actinomycetota bacterium]